MRVLKPEAKNNDIVQLSGSSLCQLPHEKYAVLITTTPVSQHILQASLIALITTAKEITLMSVVRVDQQVKQRQQLCRLQVLSTSNIKTFKSKH